jgi:hypothetical protein
MRPWGDPGTLILLRVGGANAAPLAPEFHPIAPNTLAAQVAASFSHMP